MNDIRTKIVCTLGPATDAPGALAAMIRKGMRVARFNFSHGTVAEHAARARLVRAAAAEVGVDVTLLQDLQGPKVRVGRFQGGGVHLSEGDAFTFTTRQLLGDETQAAVDYPGLPADVRVGMDILLADGAVRLTVEAVSDDAVRCRVAASGRVADRQGVNVPEAELRIPALTEKDREDLANGAKIGFDYLALSFVQRPEDIQEARTLLAQHGSAARILAKIEKPIAVERFDAILAVSDGIMVARGDLGVELDAARVPVVQKQLIAGCNRAGKPVITATQMLQSMIENARPTRAEVSDVANAILDGTDAVMLSAETSIGRYAVETVAMMAAIARETEASAPYRESAQTHIVPQTGSVQDAAAAAACTIAANIRATAIVCLTKGGTTARVVAGNRPLTPIIAAAPDGAVRRQLMLYRGITTRPTVFPPGADTDDIVTAVMMQSLRESWAKPGDRFVFTAGLPFDRTGGTNLIRVETVYPARFGERNL
jgi:pyruvate kinase